MVTSTSLFSSEMNLNSDIPIQTGGASAMQIILGLACCCCIFCIALLGVNNWKLDFLFTSGSSVGLMSTMMCIMCILILYLAFTGKESIQSAQTQIIPPGGMSSFYGMMNPYGKTA